MCPPKADSHSSSISHVLTVVELQGEVEQLKGCLQESQAECRSLHGRLHAATEQLEETAQQHNSLQKRLLCLGDSPEASVRIGELQQQVETLRAQLESRELHSRQREEGRLGWREEGRLGLEVCAGAVVFCLAGIVCCGYSELQKSLEEMTVKLTMPPAQLVGAVHHIHVLWVRTGLPRVIGAAAGRTETGKGGVEGAGLLIDQGEGLPAEGSGHTKEAQ